MTFARWELTDQVLWRAHQLLQRHAGRDIVLVGDLNGLIAGRESGGCRVCVCGELATESIVDHVIVAIDAYPRVVITCTSATVNLVPRCNTPGVKCAGAVDEPNALASATNREGVARQTSQGEVVVLINPDAPACIADAYTDFVHVSVAIYAVSRERTVRYSDSKNRSSVLRSDDVSRISP